MRFITKCPRLMECHLQYAHIKEKTKKVSSLTFPLIALGVSIIAFIISLLQFFKVI